jgi:hypothetical protein
MGVCLALTLLGLNDMRQTARSVLRNYPVIGHLLPAGVHPA